MPPEIKDPSIKVILSLTLIHFIADFYNAFSIPLLPLSIDRFSLSLAQADLFTGLSRFLAFVVQPVVYLFSKQPSAPGS